MRDRTIVCLVGSSRFKEDHERAQREETLRGRIVLPMGMYGHLEGIDPDGSVKERLDELHLRKIDLAREILIVNPDGWIGKSTTREVIYAVLRGKYVNSLQVPRVKDDVPDYLRGMFLDETAHIPFANLRPPWAT